MSAESQPRYLEPTRGTRVFNSAVGSLTRMGISVYGSRVLAVRGRKSGEWRTTPVNPLKLDGERYLIAPRGNTQWVRNMRVAGGGELRLGRKVRPISVVEVVEDDVKAPILRSYLTAWKAEVGVFFDGVGPDASDAELRQIGDILYCNSGDWVESCTALVEHFDGRLELIDWIELWSLDPLTGQVDTPVDGDAEAPALLKLPS